MGLPIRVQCHIVNIQDRVADVDLPELGEKRQAPAGMRRTRQIMQEGGGTPARGPRLRILGNRRGRLCRLAKIQPHRPAGFVCQLQRGAIHLHRAGHDLAHHEAADRERDAAAGQQDRRRAVARYNGDVVPAYVQRCVGVAETLPGEGRLAYCDAGAALGQARGFALY